MSRFCGACGNPMRTAGRLVYVVAERRLKRVRACQLCFAECVHLLIAAPLQLVRSARKRRGEPSLLGGPPR
jgi:hypothetical protein